MNKATVRMAGALCVLAGFGLLSGCASLNSMFKGSAKKMAAVEQSWTEEKYADAVSDAMKIVKDDPGFVKAKEFVRDNFQTAADKTAEQIKAAGSLAAPDNTKKQFDLYADLSRMYSIVGANVPLAGPKDAWTWQPKSIPDVSSDLEKARKAGVLAQLVESGKLFKDGKPADARKVVKAAMTHFLYQMENESDAKKATRTAAVAEIVKQTKAFGLLAMKATTLEELEEGFKTLDMADDYAKDDAEVAKLKARLETKFADVYLAEGKKLEAAGDLASLKAALKKYQDGLKKVSGNADLKAAVASVGDKIAEDYLAQGAEKEKLGDDENLKAAIALYKEGGKYASTPVGLKLAASATRASDTGAERYYRQALAAEKDMGRDPVKGNAVIAIYKQAQSWVAGYKDTNERISAVTAATTVSIFVTAALDGDTNQKIEKELAKSLKSSAGSGYSILAGADNGVVLTGNLIANGKAIEPIIKKLNPRYSLAFIVNQQKVVVATENRTAGAKTVYYRELENGTVELMQKKDYDAAKNLEGIAGGHEKFLKTQKWKMYGELSYSAEYAKRTQTMPVKVFISAAPVENGKASGKALFSKTIDSDLVTSEEILVSSHIGNRKLAALVENGNKREFSALMTADSWQKYLDQKSSTIAKSVSAEAKAIIEAIKADATM